MIIEQLYTGCLAEAAYLIVSNGEAAIIDPLRDYQVYIDLAAKHNAKIKYVFETHFHADFVSGHVDLAKATGAKIVYGPTSMSTGFEIYVGKDNEVFELGNVTFKLLHTPGHTMESSCFLLADENGKETAIFTGDTLFIGDVGRPDLAQKVIAELTQDKLARLLFHSLRNKIMPLADELIVYPNHGAGSACGKNMSKETTDTLGNQKATNYALRPDMTEDEFVEELLSGLMPPPAYFPQNVLLNITGYENVDSILNKGAKLIDLSEFDKHVTNGAIIIDTRNQAEFVKAFIPGAISIGIDGNFAVWVGTIVPDVKQKIVLITEPGREKEVVTRLARVGYDAALGVLEGGVETWKNAGRKTDFIESITTEVFADLYEKGIKETILDVRKESEFKSEHLVGAENVALDYYKTTTAHLFAENRYFVYCAGGYRSVIFCSLLKREGFNDLINIEGGFAAIKKLGNLPVTEYVCPTTML